MLTENEKADRKKKVAELTRQLIGNRSIRQTSADSGVAASYISGIINEKYLPSAETLRKLADVNAKPQSGITLEDLMIAAGYQEDYVESYTNEIQEGIDQVTQEKNWQREFKKEYEKYELLATAIIYKALDGKNISYTSEKELIGIRGHRPDLAFEISGQQISEWWFDFKYIKNTVSRASMISRMLDNYFFVKPKRNRKISLVVNNQSVFDNLVTYKDTLAYRGDLSVILFDEDTLSIVSEEYLAHYDLDSKDSEVYII